MQLFEDRRKKFAKLFFNSWDWNINNNFEYRQLRSAVTTELKLIMDEDTIKEIVKKRKRLEKTKLFIRRVITLLMNLVVLFTGWILILLINYYDEQI